MFQLLPIIFGAASLAYNLGKDYLQNKKDKESQSLAQDNLDLNKIVATQNYDLAKQQFEYQKDLNQTVMEREDNAMQRQIADLKAAGMSPLMASGGASATPLTSANAPQMDLSGVNTAMGNMLSAYNDIFNRRMTRQQFRLNAVLQTADAYNKIAEAKLQRRYLGLQADYLDAELKYNKSHGFRDLSWQSELTRFAEQILGLNPSSVNNPGYLTVGNIGNIPTLQSLSTKADDIGFSLSDPKNNILNPAASYDTKTKWYNYWKKIFSTPEDLKASKAAKKLERENNKKIDNAIVGLSLNKDVKSNALLIWSNTNADKYFKDYETFYTTIMSKIGSERSKYLNNLHLEYQYGRSFD